MFELGKKDGANNSDGNTTSQDHQPGWDAAKTDSNHSPSQARHQDVAVIGRSIRIDGDLQGEEDLRIEGDITGTIRLDNNTLTIGSEGKVRADIYAKSVAVDGSVEGDLYGSERVSVRKNAKVIGNITSPRVSLEDGAQFKGTIEMNSEAVATALGSRRGSAGKSRVLNVDSAAKENSDKSITKPKATGRNGAEKRESVG
jgi:cytoskeletal protein CcmA (bactofilin family)